MARAGLALVCRGAAELEAAVLWLAGDRARLAALRATALEHRAGRNLAENLVLLATRRRCCPHRPAAPCGAASDPRRPA
jgi:hypothetical protein